MQVDKSKRYESIVELQNELLKYRDGFATSAENANPLTLLKLWIYRNKKISSLIGLIFIIIIAASFLYVDKLNLEKENARQLAEKMRLEKDYAIKINKKAAPRFFEKAQMSYTSYELEDAARFCDTAVELNPELIDAWKLKAELHFINEEFTQAYQAALKTNKIKFITLCEKFAQIKSNDKESLNIDDLIELFRYTKEMKFTQIMIRFARHKANSNINLEDRIEFAVNSTIIMNQLDKLNFNFEPTSKHLDVSNNPKLNSAISFQNFPAKSADFSNTSIRDFISFRNQDIEKLNVSHTDITTLASLHFSNSSLNTLNISNTNVRSLFPLKNRPIEEIDISWTAVDKTGDFAQLPQLRQVQL